MFLRSTRDPAVMAEWQRRSHAYRTEYTAKSRWLRLPFYGITSICITGALLLGASYIAYFAGLEVAMLLVTGFYLSRYSYHAPECPHCGKIPFNVYRIRQAHDYCHHCGYWLTDSES
jgi:hypothetical protein